MGEEFYRFIKEVKKQMEEEKKVETPVEGEVQPTEVDTNETEE